MSSEERQESAKEVRGSDSPGYDVFISYTNDQKEVARAIAEVAHEKGIRVWIDETNLTPGSPWRDEIQAAVRNSRSCLIVLGGQVYPTDRCSALDWPEIIKNTWARPAFDLFPVCTEHSAEIPAFLQSYGCYRQESAKPGQRVSRAWLERLVDALAHKLKTGHEPDKTLLWWEPAGTEGLHDRLTTFKRLVTEQAEERGKDG